MPDFSSSTYWSDRFRTETQTGGFEWLSPSAKIIPIVLRVFEDWLDRQDPSYVDLDQNDNATFDGNRDDEDPAPTFRVLHFGCGTSSLGQDIYTALSNHDSDSLNQPHTTARRKAKIQVIDSDYVSTSLLPATSTTTATAETTTDEKRPRRIPLINMDVLNLEDLISSSSLTDGGWDLLIDKSTADAISCGPSVRVDVKGHAKFNANESSVNISTSHSKSEAAGQDRPDSALIDVEPLVKVSDNLYKVTKNGGKWICISYSSDRFPFLPHTQGAYSDVDGWKIKEKFIVENRHLPTGRVVKDSTNGEERVVYEPETGIWCYILERV